MKRNMILFLLLIPLMLFLNHCGIQPPTQDLELAKTKIAEAEEVGANEFATSEINQSKQLFDKGSKTIVNEKSGKNKDAKKLLEQSKVKAEEAYKKAAPPFAQKNISDANTSLTKGQEIKANVSAKDDYVQAEQILNEAKDSYAKQDYKTAAVKSKTAKEVAEKAYQTTLEKKNRAENAINDAKQSLNQVESSK